MCSQASLGAFAAILPAEECAADPGFRSAFAAILGDRSVVTWGDAKGGGDGRAVQCHLKTVRQIQASMDLWSPGVLTKVVTAVPYGSS